MCIKRNQVTGDVLRSFLARADEIAVNLRRETKDGRTEALAAIERFGEELAGRCVVGKVK
ncbi:MAG: hypothetical protein GXY44_12730 [Phycisphaerales bacterium]|nr:hypothetical protein [Phycisphaerales bacterium]